MASSERRHIVAPVISLAFMPFIGAYLESAVLSSMIVLVCGAAGLVGVVFSLFFFDGNFQQLLGFVLVVSGGLYLLVRGDKRAERINPNQTQKPTASGSPPQRRLVDPNVCIKSNSNIQRTANAELYPRTATWLQHGRNVLQCRTCNRYVYSPHSTEPVPKIGWCKCSWSAASHFNTSVNVSCPICLTVVDDVVLTTSCAHQFCVPCLREAMGTGAEVAGSKRCPMCRTEWRGSAVEGFVAEGILVEGGWLSKVGWGRVDASNKSLKGRFKRVFGKKEK
jgi:hypothetical protein